MSDAILDVTLNASEYPSGARVVTAENLRMAESAKRAHSAIATLESVLGSVGRSPVAQFAAVQKALLDLNTPMNSLKQHLANLEARILRIGATVAVFASIGMAIRAITSFFTEGLRAVQEYQDDILSLTASLTQIGVMNENVKKTGKNIGQIYAESAAYADKLAVAMRKVDAVSSANYSQIMQMLSVYTSTGKVLDVNNDLQMKGFTALSVAIPMMTKGQDVTRQMTTEMRALATGALTAGSAIARAIDATMKAEKDGKYANGLKQMLREAESTGQNFLELLAPYLQGYLAALPAVAQTFTSAKTSLETAIVQTQIKAFSGVSKDLVGLMQGAIDAIDGSVAHVTAVIDGLWKRVKDSMFDTVPGFNAAGQAIDKLVLKPEVLQGFLSFGNALGSIGKALLDMTLWMATHLEAITNTIVAYGIYKAAVLSVYLVEQARNAVLVARAAAERTLVSSSAQLATAEALAAEQAAAALVMETERITKMTQAADIQRFRNMQAVETNNLAIATAETMIQNIALQDRENAAKMEANNNTLATLRAKAMEAEANEIAAASRLASAEAYFTETAMMNKNTAFALESAAILMDVNAQYVATTEAKVAAITQLEGAMLRMDELYVAETALVAENKKAHDLLMTSKVRAIELDTAAATAALRHNEALLKSGATTGFASAASMRKLQIDFLLAEATQRNTILAAAESEAWAMNTAMKHANAAATAELSVATTALTMATNALKGALALVGGWFTVVVAAIMAAIYWWNKYAEAEEDALRKGKKSADEHLISLEKEVAAIQEKARLQKELETGKTLNMVDGKPVTGLTDDDVAAIKKYNDAIRGVYKEATYGMTNELQDRINKIKLDIAAVIKNREIINKNAAAVTAPPGMPGKGAESAGTYVEKFAKDKTIWEAWLAWKDGAVKNDINLEKERTSMELSVENESYRQRETAMAEHFYRLDEIKRDQLAKDNAYIQKQIDAHQSAMKATENKYPGLTKAISALGSNATATDVTKIVGDRPQLSAKPSNSERAAVQHWENTRNALVEYFKLRKDVAAFETQQQINNMKMIDSTMETNRKITRGYEEQRDALDSINVELLKNAGLNFEAHQIDLSSRKYLAERKAITTEIAYAQEEYNKAVLFGDEGLIEYTKQNLNMAKEQLAMMDLKAQATTAQYTKEKELLRIERERNAMAVVQSKRAITAANVGTDPTTGIIVDAARNEIATRMAASQTAVEGLQFTSSEQLASLEEAKSKLSLLNTLSDDQVAKQALVAEQQAVINDLKNKQLVTEQALTEERLKQAQIKPDVSLKENMKAYDALVSQASTVWPKVTTFRTAAHLVTKKYAKEEEVLNEDGSRNVLQSNKQKLTMVGDYTGLAGNMFSDLAAAEDISTRKGFESAKAYNVAAAVMSTAAAVVNALATVQPYPAAVAAAGMAAAMGAVQIAKIQSTTFGGGSGSVSAPSGSFGAGGAGSSTGSMIGKSYGSLQSTESEDAIQRLIESVDNASVSMRKVSDGLVKFTGLLSGEAELGYAPGRFTQLGTEEKGYLSNLFGGGLKNLNMMSLVNNAIVGGIKAAFGFGNKWQTTGSGVSLGIEDGGFDGSAYTTYHKKGGWFKGGKDKTEYSALDENFGSWLGDYVREVAYTTNLSAGILGTSAGISGVNIARENIATAGRSEEDIQKDLEAWLQKVGNEFAKTVKGLEEFARPGEEAFAALTRLSTSLQTVNEQFDLMNMRLFQSSLEGANLASKLMDLMGGSEEFTKTMDTYFTNAYTKEEQEKLKAAQAARTVSNVLSEINLALGTNFEVPKSREEFRAMVESFDTTTERGAQMFAELMSVSEAFGLVADAATKLKDDLVEASKETAIAAVDATKNILDKIRELQSSDSSLSPEKQYALASQRFAATSNLALSGDADALSAIPAIAQEFIDASKKYNASGAQYQADYATVLQTLSTLIGASGVPSVTEADQIGRSIDKLATAINDNDVALVASLKSEITTALGSIGTSMASSMAAPLEPLKAMQDLKDHLANISHNTGAMIVALDKFTGASSGQLPQFAVGSARIMSDMDARVHQDEMIIDAQSANVLRKYGIPITGSSDGYEEELVEEIRMLREEVALLRQESVRKLTSIDDTSRILAAAT